MTPPDRTFVNQYDNPVLGMVVYVHGVPGDPDSNTVTVTMTNEDTNAVVFTRAATRVDVGTYEVTLTSAETEQTSPMQLEWDYAVSGTADFQKSFVIIGPFSPDYAALAPGMKLIVESVWIRFADMFDSPNGGPNLQTYFQSHFTRGRISQLLTVAVGILNTRAQPYQTYTIDGDGGASFPIQMWGALLEQALYVEVLKHLRRSYVEQPMFMGGEVTRLDRRDYLDRWGQILADEQDLLKSQLDTFKIRNMGLGKPAVLVGGGVYGRYGPTRYAGGLPGRPRFYARWY
jgi:hypothetical protein